MPGAMPQTEADIAPSALTVLYGEKVDKCAGFCSSQLERYVPLAQISNRYWDNATRGCLAPSANAPWIMCGFEPLKTSGIPTFCYYAL